MYISDQKTTDFLAILALVAAPAYGVYRGSWGWLLDTLLLLAVFWMGRHNRESGFRTTAIFLMLGYGIALIVNGLSLLTGFGFVPLAALVTLWAMQNRLPQQAAVFWSLVAAGLAGIVPSLVVLHQGIPQDSVQGLIQMVMDQYQQTGMINSLQQQGLSELDIRAFLEKVINAIIMVTPAVAAFVGIVEWGVIYFLFVRFYPQAGREYRPFTQWVLPWYAVWGMILAVAGYLIGDELNWLALRSFGINLMLVYGVIAFLMGCAVFVFYLNSPRLPRLMKVLLILSGFFYFQMSAFNFSAKALASCFSFSFLRSSLAFLEAKSFKFPEVASTANPLGNKKLRA
jgi:hypothetical protein